MRHGATGITPIVIPKPLYSSEKALAAWANEVTQCLKQLAGRVPAFQGGGGRVAGVDLPRHTILPAAYIREVSGETVTWKVQFTPALLFEHSLHNAGVEHEISAGAGTLNTIPAPEIDLADGANEVWVQWGLGSDGSVTADSAELSIGTAPSPTEMVPDRPEGGSTPGVEVQKIGTITVEEGKSPVWKPAAPFVISFCYIAGIENAGDGIPVWESWADGKDRFRSIKGIAGDGHSVLHTEVASPGEVIEFRRIAERSDSTPQVQVDHTGGIITVKGNDYDTTLSNARKVSLVVRDGLVTAASDGGIDGGFTGTLYFSVQDSGGGSGSANGDFTLYLEDGLVKQISIAGGAPEETGTLIQGVVISHPEA